MNVGAGASVSSQSSLWTAALFVLLGGLIGVVFWRFQDTLAAGIGTTIALTVLTMGAAWMGRRGAYQLLDRTLIEPAADIRRSIAILLILSGVLLLAIARVLLDAFPNSADEYAYVLQAQTYAQGKLWAPAPVYLEPFIQERILAKDGIWISQYQPGWALVLAPFEAVGLPLWTINPILGVALVGVFFLLARQYLSVKGAWLATLVLALSPFFLLNFGSYFSHGLGALLAVGAALFLKKYLNRGLLRDALIAGVLVGYVGFSRVFNAAILIAPFALALILTPGRRLGMIAFGLGGIPFLGALLFYNASITGDPLLTVPGWGHSWGEPIGAPTGEFLLETIRRLKRLLVWLSPILFLGWIAAVLWLARKRKLDFTDWIAPATLLFFVFYGGEGGNQYGPRYYFEALPFIVLTAAKFIEPVLFEQAHKAANVAAAAVLAHFAYQLGFAVPRLALEHQVVVERQEPFRLAQEAGLSNSVVLIATDSSIGTRPMIPRDLTRNGLVIGDESVTYAMDLGESNKRIFAMFPNRRFYRYADGSLTPIDCAAENLC